MSGTAASNGAWAMLFVAGLLEVGFTTCMRKSEGFTRVGWALGFFVCATLSFVALASASRQIPLGTAYAVWTGIGAIGTIVVGRLMFDERPTTLALMCLALIVLGVVGVKLAEHR